MLRYTAFDSPMRLERKVNRPYFGSPSKIAGVMIGDFLNGIVTSRVAQYFHLQKVWVLRFRFRTNCSLKRKLVVVESIHSKVLVRVIFQEVASVGTGQFRAIDSWIVAVIEKIFSWKVIFFGQPFEFSKFIAGFMSHVPWCVL